MLSKLHPADAISPKVRRAAFDDLCATFDHLLRPDSDPAPPSIRADLQTFAKLLDLEFDETDADGDIWRRVRPLLAQQMSDASFGVAVTTGGPRIFLPAHRNGDEEFAGAPLYLSLLVVEDDPDLATSMVEVLSGAGHRVVALAGSAEEAASIAAHHAFDFAVVDVELAGDLNGGDLASKLHADWGARVLFISGGPNERLAEHEAAIGFLGKPFNGQELLAAVTLAAGLIQREQA